MFITLCGGQGGIRTPGASQHGGFQDRCNRPLYHLSNACVPCFQTRHEVSSSKAMQSYDYFLNPQVFCLNFSILFFTFATTKEPIS